MIVFEPLEMKGHWREETDDFNINFKQDFKNIKTKFEDTVNKILEMKIWKKNRENS